MSYTRITCLASLLVACLHEDVELVPNAATDASVCDAAANPPDPPLEILILLDNSASMGVFPAVPLSCVASLMLDCPEGDLTRTPWNVAVSELTRFVYDERSSGISLSLTYFGDSCDSDFYARPSVPMGQLPGHADAIVNSLHATIPLAGTATRPALEGVLTYAAARASLPAQRRAVILLLTDGYPDEEDCPDNTLDAVTRVAARGASAEPVISTYVFVTSTGLDFSSVARAGGTETTILADLGRIGALSEALQAVRAGELASAAPRNERATDSSSCVSARVR